MRLFRVGEIIRPDKQPFYMRCGAVWSGAVLCCAVLRCAVLCCAVLCCAVLCCAVLRCTIPCGAVRCCAVWRIACAAKYSFLCMWYAVNVYTLHCACYVCVCMHVAFIHFHVVSLSLRRVMWYELMISKILILTLRFHIFLTHIITASSYQSRWILCKVQYN